MQWNNHNSQALEYKHSQNQIAVFVFKKTLWCEYITEYLTNSVSCISSNVVVTLMYVASGAYE